MNNVQRVEPAVAPYAPILPRARVNLAVAAMLGVMLALGLTLLLEQLDNTVKHKDQVESRLGLAFLGVFPLIKSGPLGTPLADNSRDRWVASNPRSVAAECCRAIRTNLLFMSPDAPARTFAVTSCTRLEGKSTLTSNLATVMALSGQRTLLVEADMRRPRLRKTFEVDADRGLANVVLGQVSLADAICKTPVDKLDLLPSGTMPPSPAELLHTRRFREAVDEMLTRYDRILFDTPPVTLVTDATVLASILDAVIFVVKDGAVPLPVAVETRQQLEAVGGRILGVVLNQVDLSRRNYSYYGQKNLRYEYTVDSESSDVA